MALEFEAKCLAEIRAFPNAKLDVIVRIEIKRKLAIAMSALEDWNRAKGHFDDAIDLSESSLRNLDPNKPNESIELTVKLWSEKVRAATDIGKVDL